MKSKHSNQNTQDRKTRLKNALQANIARRRTQKKTKTTPIHNKKSQD